MYLTFHNNKNAVSKALTDEIGIPELEALYFDVYNFKKGVFDKKSDESQKQYDKDVEKFYKTFAATDKMPPEIKKFSDIKLKDFHNQPLCNDKDSPWSKSYHATPNHKDFDLFQKYAKHIADMTMKNKQNEQKLVQLVETLREKVEESIAQGCARASPEYVPKISRTLKSCRHLKPKHNNYKS